MLKFIESNILTAVFIHAKSPHPYPPSTPQQPKGQNPPPHGIFAAGGAFVPTQEKKNPPPEPPGRPDHKTQHQPQQSPHKTHTTKYTSPHKQSHPRAQRQDRPENVHPQG